MEKETKRRNPRNRGVKVKGKKVHYAVDLCQERRYKEDMAYLSVSVKQKTGYDVGRHDR